MLESTELDYESMLKNYSIQDVALEQSFQRREIHYNIYAETLQEYKEVKSHYLKIEEEHQILYANLTEKLNIKNCFNHLQMIPNSKISGIQKEVLDVYEIMSNDSDIFVNAVSTSMEKFENLGSEFDENAILKNKAMYGQKAEILTREINEEKAKYQALKHAEQEQEYRTNHNLKKSFLNNWSKQYELSKMKADILENEQHLTLLTKNIEFLRERNREFQDQCNIFSN